MHPWAQVYAAWLPEPQSYLLLPFMLMMLSFMQTQICINVSRLSFRSTMASTKALFQQKLRLLKIDGSSFTVEAITRFPAKPIRQSGSLRMISPSMAKLALTPPVVGCQIMKYTKVLLPYAFPVLHLFLPSVQERVIPSCILAPPLVVKISSGSFFLVAYSIQRQFFPTICPKLPIKKLLSITAMAHL